MIDIMAGDTVKCLVHYYKSYKLGEYAKVKRLDLSSAGNPVIILDNYLCDYGESQYSVDNWEFVFRSSIKKEKPVATEKTKYFAIKLNKNEASSFIPLSTEMTVTYDTASEVEKVVAPYIAKGETWLLLKTIALFEPEEPVVPMKKTYYK